MLILILLWLLIGFLVYSSIAVPVFMELALNKPKKTGDGRLSVNKNSFVAQYFYGKNIVKTKEERFFPKNNSTRLCEKLQALGLIVASAHGQKETVKFFLKHNVPHTAKVTGWGYDGKTAMSVAFENGHTEIVQMILDDFAEKLKNKLKNKRPSPDR